MNTVKFRCEVYLDMDINLEVEALVNKGCKAKIYGDPSDCYPEEPAYIEDIKAVYLNGKDILGLLNPKQLGLMEEEILDKYHDAVDCGIFEEGEL